VPLINCDIGPTNSPGGGGLADVFISYARQDEPSARRVAKALQSAGLNVWWDADLPAHRDYSTVIERNLAEAKAVVVLWSKSAAGSQWVRAEADFARNAGKLVQGQLDGTLPPMPFNQIQCADLKRWRGSPTHAGWAKLYGSIQALVSGEDQPVAAPLKNGWRDRFYAYRWAVAGMFALLVGAGVLLYLYGPSAEQRKPVLAILPFRSLDAQDASLVAGIWEDTRTAIGRNPQLIVVGPNTAEELAKKGENAASRVADYLVEASVRTAGDRVRVSADLVRTKDGEQLWSQDFDRKLDDVFALQSQIASEIEGRIRGRLAEKGGNTPEHIATTGEVYALYSDARAKIRERDFGKQMVAARGELEQVVAKDPNFAPGWATLAEVIEISPPSLKQWQLNQPSEAYARKAIDLAPNLAAAHATLALTLQLKGPVAKAELERAVQLDPSDYEALNWLAGLRGDEGDQKGALELLRRATEIEPLFWPAVVNLYNALKKAGDEAGIQALLDQEKKVGGDFLATSIEMDRAYSRGNLAEAVNIGLGHRLESKSELPGAAQATLWTTLLQLGFMDEAAKLGPAPPFAPMLWRDDPKGLDVMESAHIDAQTFFKLQPLTENAGRVFLLSGRGKELANQYLSLKLTPQAYSELAVGDGPEHFLNTAPLIAIALREHGHGEEASTLLSLAEARAIRAAQDNEPDSAIRLAAIYAVEGRKEDALPLLSRAIKRGWLPAPPDLVVDLSDNPAFASLKGEPRFEALRQRILGTIARERAQVNMALIRRLDGG
jgi:TolB-like protein/thioredoxin-like negative regulator of GroEL